MHSHRVHAFTVHTQMYHAHDDMTGGLAMHLDIHAGLMME